jgi:hypothetical protein
LSANPTVLPGPPAHWLCLCNGLCFLPSAPSPLASILLSTRSSRACPPPISIVNQLLFFTGLPPLPTHPRQSNPTPRDGESALDYAAFGMIVRNANLAVVAIDARASSNNTVATLSAGGPGQASPFIFSAYQRTCICSIQLEASLGEYPLILIALGIFTLVAGFGSQATKKMAAFFAQQSTCCFENTTNVVFPQRKAYIGTEELKHSPQKT